jgi:cytochrome b561
MTAHYRLTKTHGARSCPDHQQDHTSEWFTLRTRHLMIVTRMSFGIILSAVILIRIAWRMIPGHQVQPAVAGRIEMAFQSAVRLRRSRPDR